MSETGSSSVPGQNAAAAGVSERCSFGQDTDVKADVITCVDVFEHVADLPAVLQRMRHMLAPGGHVWASFGPPWYHPKGGHIFSVFPWAHVIFTEATFMRWRASFKPGPRLARFTETGLNKMTIRRFVQTVEQDHLLLEWIDLVPVRSLRLLHTRATQEWTTSVVRCRLGIR